MKKNIIYSFINQLVFMIIPFITFPYVSRVLGAENYGVINYATSIVSVFSVFSTTAINSYATRQVAENRKNQNKLSETVQELFIIQLVLTIITVFIYCIFVYYNNSSKVEQLVFFITGFSMLSNLFTFHWFFYGTENFKYITLRDGIIKVLFLVTIFTFVNNQNDVIVYVLLNCISLILTAVLNTTYLLKNIKLKKFSLNFTHHSKPVLTALLIGLISTLSLQFNSIFLGWIAPKEILGNYNVGIKLVTMLNTLIASSLTVLLPKLSSLNNRNNNELQKELLLKISGLLGIFSFPIAIGLFFYSSDFIPLLFGSQYYSAINVARVTSVALVFLPLIGVIYNYMYAIGEEKNAIYTMIVGFIVSIVSNIVLVPRYFEFGAGIAFVTTEFIKFLTYYLLLKRIDCKIDLFSKSYLKYFITSLLSICLPYFIVNDLNILVQLISILISITLYFTFLYLMKEPYCTMLLSEISNIFAKYKFLRRKNKYF